MRSSTADVDALLRRLLAGHLVDDDAPANYSLQLETEPSTSSGRGLHLLFEGGSLTVRTGSSERALRALVTKLSGHARGSDGATLRLAAGAVVGPAGAAVVPRRFARDLINHERRLVEAGLRLVDIQVELDPGAGQLVVPRSALEVDWSALDVLPSDGDGTSVAAGRYPVVGWATFDADGSRGRLLAQAAALGYDLDAVGPQRALDGLARLLARVTVVALPLPTEVPVAIRQLGATLAG